MSDLWIVEVKSVKELARLDWNSNNCTVTWHTMRDLLAGKSWVVQVQSQWYKSMCLQRHCGKSLRSWNCFRISPDVPAFQSTMKAVMFFRAVGFKKEELKGGDGEKASDAANSFCLLPARNSRFSCGWTLKAKLSARNSDWIAWQHTNVDVFYLCAKASLKGLPPSFLSELHGVPFTRHWGLGAHLKVLGWAWLSCSELSSSAQLSGGLSLLLWEEVLAQAFWQFLTYATYLADLFTLEQSGECIFCHATERRLKADSN